MKQDIFFYIKGKEEAQHFSLEGSLEAHDILADFIIELSKLSSSSPREILHTVSGKLQILINEKALV